MRTITTSRRKFHPLTGVPITPVGYRRNGTPIWPIMGGSEPSDTPPADPPADPPPADDPPADPPADKAPDGETAEAKAARLEADNARLRRENAADRTNAKTKAADAAKAEILATISKALGGEAGAKPPTVEELTAQLTEQTGKTNETTATLRETKAELVVWRNATDLKVDAQALTDSRAFASAIKDLDPTDAKFEESVKKAAQEALKNNPKLAAAQVAGKSGAELNGGSGEGANKKPTTLSGAVGSHYGTN